MTYVPLSRCKYEYNKTCGELIELLTRYRQIELSKCLGVGNVYMTRP